MCFRYVLLSVSMLLLTCLMPSAYGQKSASPPPVRSPSISLTSFVSFPVAIGKPVALGAGVQGVFSISKAYVLTAEVMGGTPAGGMTPSLFLMAGTGRRFTDTFVLGLNALYRFTPDYEGKGISHAFGATVAPSWKITDRLRLATPFGLVVPLGGRPTIGGSVAVKLIFNIF